MRLETRLEEGEEEEEEEEFFDDYQNDLTGADKGFTL